MHIRQTLYVSACVGASLGELLKKSFNFSGLQTTSFIRLKVNEEETQSEMQKKEMELMEHVYTVTPLTDEQADALTDSLPPPMYGCE